MKGRLALITIFLTLASSKVAFADSGVINASALNVRQKPSLSSSILTSIPRNTKINTLGKSGAFYKVTYNGKTGYVSSSYVKIGQATNASSATLSSTTKTGVGSTSVWYLNVRKTATSGNNVIGSINPTKNISIYGTLNGYYKIKYNNTWGYIAKSYVSTTTASTVVTTTNSATLSSTTKTGVGSTKVWCLNVRRTAASGNNVIGSINPTNNISLYGTLNGYYKIKYNNTWGYIAKSYVSTTSAVVTIPKSGTSLEGSTASKISNLMANANQLLGIRYTYGGATPSTGFDCSGFVQYIYKSVGVNLSRTTYTQVGEGRAVSINNLQVGDLVFFLGASHVGIYVGNNKFMQAQKTGTVVHITELSGYWRKIGRAHV